MKLDLFYELDTPEPWNGPHPVGQRQIEQQIYHEMVEQVKLADRLGFSTTWHTEHHFHAPRSSQPCPEVVLGALSQVTKDIHLGFGVTLAPHGFSHPLRTAERVATVDVLSRGRVEWGVGRSTPNEQIPFGVDFDRSKPSMWAAARQIADIWREEFYECHDEFLDMPARRMTPRPWQDPHPPGWAAATSVGTARDVGSRGLGLLYFSALNPLTAEAAAAQGSSHVGLSVEENIAAHRAGQAEMQPVTDVVNRRVGIHTLVHCTDSLSKAEDYGIWESVYHWYKSLVDFFIRFEMPCMTPEELATRFPFIPDESMIAKLDPHHLSEASMVVVGDPDSCYEKMLRYADMGADHLLCHMRFGYLPHEQVMKSIELVGTKLIPALESAGVQVTTTVSTDPAVR